MTVTILVVVKKINKAHCTKIMKADYLKNTSWF